MADSIIGVKIVPDARAVQQVIRQLEAQRRGSVGSGRVGSGYAASKVMGGPLATEESVRPQSAAGFENLTLAQNRYADLLAEKTRREAAGLRVSQRDKGAGISGFTDAGLASQLGKANAAIEAWVQGVTREMTSHARGTSALLNSPEALQAAGLREMMRQTWGRETRMGSDEQRQQFGMPSRYQENLSDRMSYEGQRQSNSEAQVKFQQMLNDRQRDTEFSQMLVSSGMAGPAGSGTSWQKFQNYTHAMRSGGAYSRPNVDNPTFGKYMAEHAGRTLGYAIPGIAIGLGFEEISKTLKESQQAQRSMAELQAQFQGLGQGAQFSGFATSIKNVASETGVAVSEVVQLGMAMKGVYGSTDQATIATKSLTQATVTMDMGLQEARQDLTAISQSFGGLRDMGGSAMTAIQNELLHLQDLTGVTAKSLAPGIADVAPTAAIAGLSFNQTASTVAAAAQHAGLSSETIGETYSKIITSLQSNPQLVLSIANQLGIKNIASQTTGSQIQSVMSGMSGMMNNPAMANQFSYILSQLGINSSALPAANAIFSTAGQAQGLSKSQAPSDRAEEEFKKQMDTLSGRLGQLRSDFTNLGVAILNSGLGKGLTELADGVGLAVRFLAKLNDYAGPQLLAMLGLTAGFWALEKGLSVMTTLFGAMKGLTLMVEAATLAEKGQAAGGAAGGAARFLFGLGTGTALAKGAGGVAAEIGGVAALDAGLIPLVPLVVIATMAYLGAKGMQNPITNAYAKGGAQGVADWVNQPFITADHKKARDAANAFGTSRGPTSAAPVFVPGVGWVAGGPSAEVMTTRGKAPIPTAKAGPEYVQNSIAGQIRQNQVNQYLAALANQQAQRSVQGQDFLSNPGDISTAYQTGNLSQAQAVYILATQTSQLHDEFKKNPSSPAWQAYLQSQQALNQQITEAAQQTQQVSSEILSNSDPSHNVALLNASTANLKAAMSTGSPQAIAQAFSTYAQQVQQNWQTLAANATSATEQIADLTQSQQIPADVQQALAKAANESLQQWQAQNNGGVVQGFMSPRQKYQVYQQYTAAQQQLAATQSTFGASDPAQQAQAAQQAAQANLQSLTASSDANTADLQTAKAQLAQANQQVKDAAAQNTQAVANMYAQIFANAPLQAAQYQMQALQSALATAHSAAEASQVKGQISQLQQQIAQDTINLADAQSAIAQATQTAQGNPIQAAYTKYQQDLRDITSRRTLDKSLHVNQSQDTQLQQMISQSIGDNTSYLQTQFSTMSQNVQTELYLGQITATQAIAQLETGMAAAKGNQQLVLQYQQAIRQIQNSAGANLNFDLPTTLVPTTLYQARALEAHLGSFQGAASQPQTVTVNINVSGDSASSVSSAVSKLTAAVAGPSRSGNTASLLGT